MQKSYNVSSAQTTIILFGAMGDLAWRKLLPSLLDLHNRNALPKDVHIVGASRESETSESFKKYVQSKLPNATASFIALLSYHQIDLLSKESYTTLDVHITKIEGNVRGNRLIHLAVPPTLYKDIFINLGKSGIAKEVDGGSWSRILVEKPFGFDLETAQELNRLVKKYFTEQQIYRVDHYLAKEAVESLMAFRFTNVLFAHTWDKSHIESVHIRMHERLDVANRGSFYESVGALRDVGQNHLLQLLALIAMEQPASLTAEAVSAARAEVLANVQVYTPQEVLHHASRAQYEGYRAIPQVPNESLTETYFAITAFITTDRWAGVPFVLEGGKALAEDRIDITIQFKRDNRSNTLTFTLKPENKTEISFWVKKPGFEYKVEEHALTFTHSKAELLQEGDAYTQIIYDALKGEKLVFPSSAEVEASWKFVDAIISGWQSIDAIPIYKKGTVPNMPNNTK